MNRGNIAPNWDPPGVQVAGCSVEVGGEAGQGGVQLGAPGVKGAGGGVVRRARHVLQCHVPAPRHGGGLWDWQRGQAGTLAGALRGEQDRLYNAIGTLALSCCAFGPCGAPDTAGVAIQRSAVQQGPHPALSMAYSFSLASSLVSIAMSDTWAQHEDKQRKAWRLRRGSSAAEAASIAHQRRQAGPQGHRRARSSPLPLLRRYAAPASAPAAPS